MDNMHCHCAWRDPLLRDWLAKTRPPSKEALVENIRDCCATLVEPGREYTTQDSYADLRTELDRLARVKAAFGAEPRFGQRVSFPLPNRWNTDLRPPFAGVVIHLPYISGL
jgi:hypothetical protein